MLDKERVGMRIRQVRTEQQRTLRDVEGASGFSSTHISEIERGRTCPTIGALVQIAGALGKDPSYFIEERELQEIEVTAPGRRAPADPRLLDFDGTGMLLESLTPGILGGRLEVLEVTLEPEAQGKTREVVPGTDLVVICLEGTVEVQIDGGSVLFSADDSAHSNIAGGFELRNAGRLPARVLLILDPATIHP